MDRSVSLREIILAAVVLVCFVCRAEPSDYVVGPGDVIRIEAYEAEKVSGKFPVDSKGFIKHFILGKAGMGLMEFSKDGINLFINIILNMKFDRTLIC
jgi:hypothetical protein